ncbi:hypothetical protein [Trichoplusia ni ascovirus 2c]|uniref:hypothetical protein n=1 Tax=Trichoplusia ni ascovirus 2c TaxID=328615 RepID=UPI0000E4421A|nr:hypothetical protein TNAV2c_gp066 [Trichoplusia ni ascovirus 2c]ABF70583.1 hypothetical protein [Trichoplusia ni ascovirus 2c]
MMKFLVLLSFSIIIIIIIIFFSNGREFKTSKAKTIDQIRRNELRHKIGNETIYIYMLHANSPTIDKTLCRLDKCVDLRKQSYPGGFLRDETTHCFFFICNALSDRCECIKYTELDELFTCLTQCSGHVSVTANGNNFRQIN